MIDPHMSREPERLTATPSQTVGPFFHFGLATRSRTRPHGARGYEGQARSALRIRVADGDGEPVPDALIELWQADADGRYARPEDPAGPLPPAFTGFGRLPTDADGRCCFETIRPGRVADPQGRMQAPHINVCFFARGLLRQIFTRVYFEGDDGLDLDPILSLVPEARRSTLVARRDNDDWQFDLRLQGANETVFFDL